MNSWRSAPEGKPHVLRFHQWALCIPEVSEAVRSPLSANDSGRAPIELVMTEGSWSPNRPAERASFTVDAAGLLTLCTSYKYPALRADRAAPGRDET